MKRGSGPILNPELKTLPAMYKVQLPPGRLPLQNGPFGEVTGYNTVHTHCYKNMSKIVDEK